MSKSDEKSFVDERFLGEIVSAETFANALHNNLQQCSIVTTQQREVYFPQYNKIYVGLNDSNKTKWTVAGKAQGPS